MDAPIQAIHYEAPYRWVIISLMGLMFLINGLTKLAVIPISSQLVHAYSIDIHKGSLPIILPFIVFSIFNFPANHIIDVKGLRISFIIGASLFTLGTLFYAMVNMWYYFTVMGAVFVAAGQPFLVNCPAKIATYWFTAENVRYFKIQRPFATSVMTGQLLVGIGLGFILPGLAIGQKQEAETVQRRVFLLYSGYFIAALVSLLLILLFMRKQPDILPSFGAQKKKTNLRESFVIIGRDPNLIKFFAGYSFILGGFLAFQATLNPIFRLFGFSEVEIIITGEIFIIFGVPGSILASLFIKRTRDYRRAIRFISLLTFLTFIAISAGLYFTGVAALVISIAAVFGFVFESILPVCYDLGCEMSFPIGQAQVIGVLNGGSMILTFVLTIIITNVFTFENKGEGFLILMIYSIVLGIGCFLFFRVRIVLRRLQQEKEKDKNEKIGSVPKSIEMMEKNQQDNKQVAYNVTVKLEAFEKFISEHKQTQQDPHYQQLEEEHNQDQI